MQVTSRLSVSDILAKYIIIHDIHSYELGAKLSIDMFILRYTDIQHMKIYDVICQCTSIQNFNFQNSN